MACHSVAMGSDDTRTFWDDQAATFDDHADHGLTDPATRQAWAMLLGGFIENPRTDLSAEPVLWRKEVTDHRYAADGRRPRHRRRTRQRRL